MAIRDFIKKALQRKSPKKPEIKKESATWQKQFLSGKFPRNSTTAILAKYTNPTKGTPNKRALRSRSAREEYNKALEKFNRERMTVKKQAAKDEAIRAKQLAHVAANVAPEAAEKAKKNYGHMVDMLRSVYTEIKGRIAYNAYDVAERSGVEVQNMTEEDFAQFVKTAWDNLQESLPSFAKKPKKGEEFIRQNKIENEFTDVLTEILKQTGTTNIDDLEEALKAKGTGTYTEWLHDYKEQNGNQKPGKKKKPGQNKKRSRRK